MPQTSLTGNGLRRPLGRRGLTLIEVMVAVSILTIGVLAFIGTFAGISKSIRVSKSKTIATNLNQEKIEYMKNISYYRLLVTTSPVLASESGLGSFPYDSGYYPPEDLTVGQINFERRILIQKVTETGGTLSINSWDDADTGLKLITAYIIWDENGEWKKLTISNLRDDPQRAKMTASFRGTVTSGGPAVPNVNVICLQNLLLRDVSDAAGAYDFTVSPGTYTLQATKRGYFPMDKSGIAVDGAPTTLDFPLVQMGSGTVSGIAFVSSHLVISEICASLGGDNQLEYVELYNPTSAAISLGSSGSPEYQINWVRKSDGAITVINPADSTRYVNTSVPPNGYFLFASSAVVNNPPALVAPIADAYYSDTSFTDMALDDRIKTDISAGITLVTIAGSTVDAVGWGKAGGSPFGPANAREGSGIHLAGGAGADGLADSEDLERIAYSSSTENNMRPFFQHGSLGNAYDSNDNSADFVQHTVVSHLVPQNSLNSEVAQTGTPAVGAYVGMDDGLSSSSQGSAGGVFNVTSVATGTWAITSSSSGFMYMREGISVINAVTTNIGIIRLSTVTTGGYASGRVVNTSVNPIQNVLVSASGGSDITDSNGLYRMQLAVGTFTVIANSGNGAAGYTTEQATGVVVNAGLDTVVPDITLQSGGTLRGFVTTNGTDPLPGIVVMATSTSAGYEMQSVLSDSLGIFRFPNLPIGTYAVTPQLQTGESASPPSWTGTVVSAVTTPVSTFTVSNAFGTLGGQVTKAGNAIQTGVLIIAVATPTTISSANPPDNTQTMRNSATVYYTGSSRSDGTYSISLRGGTSYNVYGWYTSFSGTTPTVTKLSGSKAVGAGASATLNLDWP